MKFFLIPPIRQDTQKQAMQTKYFPVKHLKQMLWESNLFCHYQEPWEVSYYLTNYFKKFLYKQGFYISKYILKSL